MNNLLFDLRFAARQLIRQPAFTLFAVLTLALGIGANTAIFSVINTVLLKPLPYRDPDRIVMLWTDNPSMKLGFPELPPTPPDLLEWREQAKSFEQIAGFRPRTADLAEFGDPERVGGVQTTANFFSVLGIQPKHGRLFTPEEERDGAAKVAVISHALWQRRFGGDLGVLGKRVSINRGTHEIIGVMPAGFHFPRGPEMPAAYGLLAKTDVWTPYAEPAKYWQDHSSRDYVAMGRLKPDVTVGQAQAEMVAIAARQAAAYPASHTGWTVNLRALSRQVAGGTRPVLLALLGAVAFVLLIACANVANLLLCRSAGRRKEMAVRAAIGAGRARVIRQLLTESVLLAALGGVAGLLLGALGLKLILAISPANIPRLHETSLEGSVLVFTVLVSLATGILFGLAPAWSTSRANLAEVLNSGARGGAVAGRPRAHALLVTGEIAMVVVLLVGAGLMIQSFLHLQAVDPGFKPQQVLAFDVSLFGDRYQGDERVIQFHQQVRERLAALPGVRSVAAISSLPLGGSENLGFLQVEGAPPVVPGQEPAAEDRKVTPGYFAALGITFTRGRDFTAQDGPNQPRVCIVNEALAREHFLGTDPLGKRIRLGGPNEPGPLVTIVGVTRNVRGASLETRSRAQVCFPLAQAPQNEMTIVVRGEAGGAESLERSIRAALKAIDPALPPANFRAMENLVVNALARPRFGTSLLGAFAAIALILTLIGLYGVVAYAASQRTREIGIRMALGAKAGDVLALIIRQGMKPALIGLAIGIAGALAATRLLATQLYDIKATDPVTFAGVGAFLLLTTLAACWVPARRATRVDPMVALRQE